MDKALLILAAALLCSLTSVKAQFICNGQIQTFVTPVAPFPTAATFFYPIATPTGLACTRKDQPAEATDVAIAENQFCGGRESFTCSLDGTTFGPVGPITHGTGGSLAVGGLPEAIIPPSNPIIYSFTSAAPNAYFTYVRFTAVDVGTAGAKLGGVYGTDPTASPAVIAKHEWVPNGAREDGTCAACSSCVIGQGVANLTVESAAGAGFRAIQLSALYEDVRCGGACRDFDGMYWYAREYKCIEPTCGDVDLNTPGNQAFDCAAVGLNFNASAADVSTPSSAVCCQSAKSLTCEDSDPNTPDVKFSCPPGKTYNATAGDLPATEANCCFTQQNSRCHATRYCLHTEPGPGPWEMAGKQNPSPCPPNSSTCCCFVQEFTCAKSNAAGDPFTCPAGFLVKPGSDNVSPPNVDNCCVKKEFNCANSNEAGEPFTCPAGFTTKPGSDNVSPPNVENCCVKKDLTCAKSNDAGEPFTCPAGFATKPGSENASPPSVQNCCIAKEFTCAKSNDAGDAFTCPAGFATKPGSENASPPSVENCCIAKELTCAKSNDADERYQCPAGWQVRPGSDNLPPTLDNCCECIPKHFGKFGKFFGKGGSACIRPPSPPPSPGPHPPTPPPHEKVIQIGPLRITKPGTFQILPFPMPFFGRR